MAGGHMKYRHLSRSSSHRQALLRNLVTSLFKHETIATTWHKAKEAQRLAEQLVTMGKKNTEATRRRATQIFFVCARSTVFPSHAHSCQEPNTLVPKLFGPIRERYLSRPGGYTRILRIEPIKEDQAESAILELVDGPRDLRFAMTAKTLAQNRPRRQFSERTAEYVKKVTRYRSDGVEQLQDMVQRMRIQKTKGVDQRMLAAPKKVYPEEGMKREMHYYEDKDFYYPANRPRVTRNSAEPRKRQIVPHQPSASQTGVTELKALAS
jgi:ribosomal protein L17